MKCICDPLIMNGHHYVQFIGTYFRICAYTPRDIIGFVAGLLNICCWLFAQLPQLVENYRNKTGESLSIPFLSIWLVGDFANLLGCILTNQSKIQLYTSIYFLVMDTLVLGQFFYYRKFYKKPQHEDTSKDALLGDNEHSDSQYSHELLNTDYLQDRSSPQIKSSSPRTASGTAAPSKLPTLMLICMTILSLSSMYLADSSPLSHLSSSMTIAEQLSTQQVSPLWVDGVPPHDDFMAIYTATANLSAPICDKTSDGSRLSQIIGTFFAWVCSMMYFASRIPQCVHNYKRQSTRGLSFALFFMSFLANVFYGIAVLLPNTTDMHSTGFWRDTLAYLIGSLGANIFNFFIIVQFFYYNGNPPVDEAEQHVENEVTTDLVFHSTNSTRSSQYETINADPSHGFPPSHSYHYPAESSLDLTVPAQRR